MPKTIQAIRGMNDILPDQTPHWQYLENTARQVLAGYGYEEIRFPLLEQTELFARSIGELTDIVEKEMYTFADRNGDMLTLRPEGTASCVRAAIENGLLHNQQQRLWYIGPMFRHERPQKGRYRQFHQIGVEAFGMPGPDIDAELILLTARLWRQLGLRNIELHINSLGSSQARAEHRQELIRYLTEHYDDLDEDSRRRLQANPLRILDSKNPALIPLLESAPTLQDYLDPESRLHFSDLCARLDAAGIAYRINPCLVRGLDYYNRTVFEWISHDLGAQATICGGGRYDGLVEQIGGKPTPAAGFAMGLERLVMLLGKLETKVTGHNPHAYMVIVGERAETQGLMLAERLRNELTDLKLIMNCSDGSFKSQLKRADKSGAVYALIIGKDEAAGDQIIVKNLRRAEPQLSVHQQELAAFLGKALFATA